MSSLLNRLKERKVVQWALAYLAGGWVVLEVLGFVGDNFGWPPFVVRSLIVLVAAGLPVVVVLAWYHGEKGRQRVSGAELLILTGLLVAGGAALVFLGPSSARTLSSDVLAIQPDAVRRLLTSDARPSLAVLPFANRSGLEEDRYFTDGMHDEILTRISRIKGLRTTPRTSVEAYREAAESVLQIGTELAVAYVLQGSVQRAGDQVRISVQLVDANTEDHLWSDEYTERATPEDLLEIQSRVTAEVARELRLVVAEEEERRMVRTATTSGEAYDWYLRALAHWRGPQAGGLRALEVVDEQAALLQRALDADPQFGRVHAQAARMHLDAISWGVDRTTARSEMAKSALDEASRLAPDDPETRLIQAEYHYVVELDPTRALEVLIPIENELGQDEDYLFWKGIVERRQGDWTASTQSFQEAIRLNPRNALFWVRLGLNYSYLRQFEDAEEADRTALELSPSDDLADYLLGQIPLQRDGDIRAFRAWAEGTDIVWRLPSRLVAAHLDRDWEGLEALLDQGEPDVLFEGPMHLDVRPLWHAKIARANGRVESSRRWAGEAARLLQEELSRRGEDRRFSRALAVAHALRGDAAAADSAMGRALRQLPLDRDPLEAAWVRQDLAAVHAFLGRRDEALQVLSEFLTEPGFATVPMIELDPTYDSLREDPRFQAMLQTHAAQN